MLRKLDVYLRDIMVGTLDQNDDAELVFAYDHNYVQSDSARAISVSMPLSVQPYSNTVAKPYFAGLLPDESARKRLAAALGISDTNAFGMLEIIGGECAGALALYPQGHIVESDPSADEILSDQQLAELLIELRGNPLLGGRKDIRLSLAGAQDKLAIKLIDNKIALVKNGEPTTHIIKPNILGLEGTAQNETFCMMLASRVGLPAAEVQYAKAGETDFIMVKRFDRTISSDGAVERLHQEDFCQALSVPPELKYEDEGGPSIANSLDLIKRVVNRPARDHLAFLRMQIFHYLVGNADAHAKNFALLYPLDTRSPSLAPLYDVVCTASYPELAKRTAMKIGGRNLPDTIHLKHWLSILPNSKASQNLLIKELTELTQKTSLEAESLFRDAEDLGFMHPVLKDILRIIKTRTSTIWQLLA